MKTPDWYRIAVAEHGAKVIGGEAQRADAAAKVASLIQAHPEFVADLAAAMSGRDIARWIKEHESSGDLFQAALFPLLPASMRVNPRKSVPVSDMTAADLDNAKAMLWNRTQNQIDGTTEAAEHERSVFLDFYQRVRPLLADDLTVRDVLAQIGKAA